MATQTSAIEWRGYAHPTAFVFTDLASEHLGHERGRNHDGRWTEWGSSVLVPIER